MSAAIPDYDRHDWAVTVPTLLRFRGALVFTLARVQPANRMQAVPLPVTGRGMPTVSRRREPTTVFNPARPSSKSRTRYGNYREQSYYKTPFQLEKG